MNPKKLKKEVCYSIWFVYLILSENQSFYTGITNQPENRWNKHLLGKGAKFFRSTRPLSMKIVQITNSKSDALKQEIRLKRMTSLEKKKLFFH